MGAGVSKSNVGGGEGGKKKRIKTSVKLKVKIQGKLMVVGGLRKAVPEGRLL